MTTKLIIILILILIIIASIVAIYLYLKNKITRLSNEIFKTPNIIEGLKQEEIEYSKTPKSLSSMDSVIIPKIIKDFPNLDINEMKKRAENALRLYFTSLESNKVKDIKDSGDTLINKLNLLVNEKKYSISAFKIHRTVINSYTNKKGSCIITFQSAIEYKKKTNTNNTLIQSRYNIDMIYIYDDTKLDGQYGVSLNCKNCGAPIKELGTKSCPYCGTGVVEYTSKTWKINDIYEK